MKFSTATGRVKANSAGLMRRTLQTAVLIAVAATVPAAWSAGSPTIKVTNVAAGSASISQAGAITTVRTYTQNTIINYQQLDVGTGETLQFLQPNVTSRVLNRISGTMPTTIDGTITSNGVVYLVNPAGVMFGQGAVVSAAGFFAAGSHISDQSFLSGLNQFTNSTGAVVNYGVISAEQVHLLGVQAANFGQVIAGDTGVVTMTAGKDVLIGATDSAATVPHVFVKVSNNTAGVVNPATGVTNAGTVRAGQIQLGAGDMYAAGIYNSGLLKGKAITLNSNGNTTISTGTLDASNANGTGGSVQILGAKVGVAGTVNASGTTGGGTVRIGGDLHGGAGLPTSEQTNVGSGAVIKADATVSGDGGSVVVWSNEATRFYGLISAQGGPMGGNGGMVEVSSKANLTFAGTVNTLAPAGTTGTLLLDPSSITVDDTLTADFTALTQVDQFGDPNVGGNVIHTATIDAATTNVVLQATGNITFNSAVAMSNVAVGLTVQAGGNIVVNNSITTQGGAIVLSAGDQTLPGNTSGTIALNGFAVSTTGGGQGGANITLRTSGVSVTAGAQIVAGTGTVAFEPNVSGDSISVGANTGNMPISAAVLGDIVSAGTVRIGNATAGEITLTGTSGVLDLSGLAANVTLQNRTSSTIDFMGTDLKLAGSETLTIIGSGGVTANGGGFSAESSGGTIIFQNVGGDIGSLGGLFATKMANLGGATGTGSIYLVNTGAFTVSGTVLLTGGSGNSVIGANSPLTVNAAVTMDGNFFLEAGNNVVASGDNLTIAANVTSATGGTVNLIAGDNVKLNSGTISGGTVAITANNESDLTDGDTGSITQMGANAVVANSLTAAATTGISLTSAGNEVGSFTASNTGTGVTGGIALVNTGTTGLALSLGAITQAGTGAVAITSTGAISQTAAISAAGADVTVNTAGGIALTNDSNTFSTVSATNITSGDIAIHTGATTLKVEGLSESGGGATFLISGAQVNIDGTVSAGAGLTVNVNLLSGRYFETSNAAITVGGDVQVVSDAMFIDPASSLNAGAHTVTLRPFTAGNAIGLGVASMVGTLGLTNAELATFTAGKVVIGSTSETGDITGTGTLNLPASVQLITTGNVDLSGATITSAAASGFGLEVDHGGTFMLADATVDGGLAEFGASGSGAGGLVTLTGTITTTNSPVSFNSSVAISGAVSIVTNSSGGGTVSFAAVNGATGSDTLSVDAGTGDVNFNGAIGAGTGLVSLTVVSGNDVNLQSAIAGGENITNAGVLTINGTQTLGAGGFVQSGATSMALKGDIVTAGTGDLVGSITLNSPVALTGNRTLDTTNDGATAGADITVGGAVTGGATGLTLVAGASDVAVNASIMTSGAFASSGAAFDNTADIGALSITLNHTGLVTLGGSLTADGGDGAVAINGAGVTQSAGIINAGNLALTGTGAFTLTDNNTVGTLAADITGGLTFVNDTGLAVGSAGSPTVNGITTNDGNVQITVNTGDLTTSQAIVAGAGTVSLTATSGSVLASGDISGSAVTIHAAVAISVTGVTTTGGDIDLGPVATITLNGDLNAGTGDVVVSGSTIMLGADLTVTGTNVTFGGTVDGGQALTVDASTLATFQGDVGDTTPLVSLMVDVGGATSLNGSITAGTVAINNPLTLTADSVITTTGTASFGDVITGGGLFSLDVEAGGGSTFTGTIGQPGGSELSSFTVGGGTATLSAPTVTTIGDQTYNAAVLIGGTANFTGVNVSFNSSLNTTGGSWDVTINASGTVTLAGPSGSALDPLNSLTINGATGITLGSVTSTGDITISDGPITTSGQITSVTGNIELGESSSASGLADITLAGDTSFTAGGQFIEMENISGPFSATFTTTGSVSESFPRIIVFQVGSSGSPIGDLTFNSLGHVYLQGSSIFAHNVTFAGSDGGDLASVPEVSTISAFANIDIETTGSFTMKLGQKFSLFDPSGSAGFGGGPPANVNLTINTHNNPLTVGDIAATGSITLDYGTSTLTVGARAPALLLQHDGTTIMDKGTSIVSGVVNGLDFIGNSKVILINPASGLPAGTLVQIGSQTGVSDLMGFSSISGVTVLKINQTAPVTQLVFESSDFSTTIVSVLSDQAFGPSSAVNAVGAFISPRVDFTVQTELTALDAAQRDSLRELGVFARDPRISEILDYLIGQAIYDDVPYMLNPSPQDTQVVSNRLPYSPVIQTVDAFRSLFFKTVTDEHGKQTVVAQDTTIRNALGQAWQLYMSKARREQATADRFRAFLEATEATEPKAAKALGYLNQLRDLLVQIQTLGLTQTEFEVSQKVLLAKVRPANIKEADFLIAVNGPSSKGKDAATPVK